MRTLMMAATLLFSTVLHADPDAVTQGKEHFRKGTQLYDTGHYDDAAREYELAFQLTDRPLLLFNLGQAYRLGAKPKQALAAYQGYLRRVPDAPQRAEVEQHLADLQEEIRKSEVRVQPAVEPPAPAPIAPVLAAPVPPPHKDRPLIKKPWFWVVVVSAAAVVGVGVGLGVGLSSTTQNPVPSWGTINKN